MPESFERKRMGGILVQERQRMIKAEDIQELFIRSSGPGGQNVNKVATCVVLKHLPTGIVVKCQEFRTQGRNRQRARELLAFEIERRLCARAEARKDAFEIERRRSRGRSRPGKERVLDQKKRQAKKKTIRARVRLES